MEIDPSKLDYPYQFARLYQTPTFGQVVLVDDTSTLSLCAGERGPSVTSGKTRIRVAETSALGFYEIFTANEDAIARHMLPKDPRSVFLIAKMLRLSEPEQAVAIEKMMITIHQQATERNMAHGRLSDFAAMASPESKRVPFAKVFNSDTFGQVLVMRDGKMEVEEPHILVRWRPEAPHDSCPCTLISSKNHLRDFNQGRIPLSAVREKVFEMFCGIDKAKVEDVIGQFLEHNRKQSGPVIHFSLA